MIQDEFRSHALGMLYLAKCAANGETPDSSRIQTMNLEKLYEVAQAHSMSAITAYALESAGIKDRNFTIAKEKAIRKTVLFDADRKKILSELEQNAIWYMPLKGAILKEDYPKLGMRQMSDNDILFDSAFREKVRDIMLELGFTVNHYGNGNDDAYFKQPVSNFEMHNSLFSTTDASCSRAFTTYYANVKERLLKDDNHLYGWHFSVEDFYLYMTAHEYQHYCTGGTGVRSLLDAYVFLKKRNRSMDWDYIHAEALKLEIDEYEQQSRRLAMKLFAEQPLTEEESQLLDYYIFSGTYGTNEHAAENRVKHFMEQSGGKSRSRYLFERFFPPMEIIRTWYPFFYRYKIFLPVLWFIVRPFKALTVNRSMARNEFRQLNKKSDTRK